MEPYPQFKKIYEFTYVWLKRNTESAHFFYCNQCQNPILRYQGQAINIIPAGVEAMSMAIDSVMSFPMETKCNNKNCPAKYLFEGFTI